MIPNERMRRIRFVESFDKFHPAWYGLEIRQERGFEWIGAIEWVAIPKSSFNTCTDMIERPVAIRDD
jgi:hypothetical protein